MHCLWIAALLVAAKSEPVIVVARVGDTTSLAAPTALKLLQSDNLVFWTANAQTVSDTALRMHLTPFVPGDLPKLREPATELFKRALVSGQFEDFRRALSAALSLPPTVPATRSNAILNVERAFASALVSSKLAADSLMLDIGFRTGFALESFDRPEVAKAYLLVAGQAHHHPVEVSVRMSVPFDLSIDGSAFAPPPPSTRLLPGTHEIAIRVGDRLGLLHTLDVVGGQPQTLELRPEIERALFFTPDGFFLRAGEKFTTTQAAMLRNGSDAGRVWLVEAAGDHPPLIRITVSDGTTKATATVPLPNSQALNPSGEAQQRQLAEAVIAGAHAAETAGAEPLAKYDVTREANGDLALVAVKRVPLYEKWWLWTALGSVVVAGTITAVVLATRDMNVTLISRVTSH